jgi:aconitate hydratase 2/2-methylisocitrate dehydratase
MCALLGKIPSKEEYMQYIQVVNAKAADIYRYMNFDQIPAFVEVAETVEM